MRLALGLTMAASLLTGGCRQSEADVRAELRSQFLQRCRSDLAASGAVASPGFDAERFCGCVTDRAIADRGLDDIRALFADDAKAGALARRAGVECQPTDVPALPPLDSASAEQEKADEAEKERREREEEARRERRKERAREDRPGRRVEPAEEAPVPRLPITTPPPATAPAPAPQPPQPPPSNQQRPREGGSPK